MCIYTQETFVRVTLNLCPHVQFIGNVQEQSELRYDLNLNFFSFTKNLTSGIFSKLSEVVLNDYFHHILKNLVMPKIKFSVRIFKSNINLFVQLW